MTTGTETAQRFFASNGASYDRIANLSTLGLDIWWKKKILDKIPLGSRTIIDQACGTGILTLKIARRFPHSRIIGVDLHDEYLAIARQKAQDLHLSNVEFIAGRAEDIVFDGSVDCITSSYLAKYADLDLLVGHARKMLRDGGVLVVHELTYPIHRVCIGLWNLQFEFLQTYGAWKYPEWETAFRELPVLLKETKWVEELKKTLEKNRFSIISTEPLAFEAAAIITAVKER
jgi:demethylmenaquinone methyltransferase/2-methoxy-6-polyprenyl-1,4-benzoquinol methylase